jgi:branched-subunit amino acid aminotransferase/4-amino-4-deoxychorismate lyase
MIFVWLNGRFVPLEDAKVSAFDAGLQHGVGLFETMLARDGRILHLEAHLKRLDDSARALRLTESLRLDPLEDAVELTLAKNELKEARIRLTLTGGDLNLLHREPGTRANVSQPTILIHAQPPTRYPDEFFEQGVLVTIADTRLNPLDPFAGHKTLNYWPRLSALQEAAGKSAGEAIWFTVSNHLAGGSVSNIFLVKDGALLTPIARGEEESVSTEGPARNSGSARLPSPMLPGVTRAWILNEAKELDLGVGRRMLDINDLLGADEVFLTNSSWGILPVVQVERERIGPGKVGEVATLLRRQWLSL